MTAVTSRWHLLDDDVWLAMSASYWRLTDAIERAVRDAVAEVPDWMAASVAKDVRETAYLKEREAWSAGMNRLCALYGVPEAPPESQETHTAASQRPLATEIVSEAIYVQEGML